jgi:hypothetical protein
VENQDERSKQEILKDFKADGKKFIYVLKEPIEFGQETIKEFILEKPKAKHIRNMPKDAGMDAILKVIGSLSGQPDSVIDELDFPDMNVLAEFFTAFS